MSYGMTYEQFWYGDPYMASAYRDAYILKRRIDNENAWIAGAYTMHALTAALNNAFSKTSMKYVKAPFDIFPKTRAEKNLEITAAKNKLIEQLSAFQAAFNARRRRKKKNKGVDEDGNNP
jgi:hypothetical protein